MNDPLNEILEEHIEFLNFLYSELESDGLLCSSNGQEIVSIYKFHGGYNEVLAEFKRYIELLEKVELTDELREKLYIIRGLHVNFRTTNPYTEQAKKIGNPSHLITPEIVSQQIELWHKASEYEKELHDKKECLCYSNKIQCIIS